MQNRNHIWRGLLKDDSGQSMIEYVLIAALIALGAVAGMQGVATALSTTFSKIGSDLSATVT